MGLSKIFLVFRLLFLLLFFRFRLIWGDVKSCLLVCEKPGYLNNLEDLLFADQVLRKLLHWFPLRQDCLLHSLALARSSKKNLEIYFSVLQKDPFLTHSFVKVEQTFFSTSLQIHQDSLLVWRKEC